MQEKTRAILISWVYKQHERSCFCLSELRFSSESGVYSYHSTWSISRGNVYSHLLSICNVLSMGSLIVNSKDGNEQRTSTMRLNTEWRATRVSLILLFNQCHSNLNLGLVGPLSDRPKICLTWIRHIPVTELQKLHTSNAKVSPIAEGCPIKLFKANGRTDGRTKGNPISPFRNFVATGDN